jgi:hypothetical protein
MTTKTTGAELKKFYIDPIFWPAGAYHEDVEITVNGVVMSDGGIAELADSAKITVSGGVVFDLPGIDSEDAPSFVSHFKSWRKLQHTAFMAVECPQEKLDAVIAAIVAAGGKVT